MNARGLLFGLAAVVPLVTVVAAREKPHEVPQAAPATYQTVLDCRRVAEPQARLACYDRAVAALDTATAAHDILVIDRATVRATKRGLFGLNLPRIKLFGGNDDVEVDQIESTITATSTTRDGDAVFVLADGSR